MANQGASETEVLGEGKFLRLVRRGKWEFAERTKVTGVVGILAVTEEGKLLLVEQWREPVGAFCIELPAGVVGDVDAGEDAETSAARELEEETGYRPARLERLAEGCVSPGLTGEVVSLYRARGLTKTGPGGGDEHEAIEVHAIAVEEVPKFLAEKQSAGRQVDWKLWAGLWFLGRDRAAK